MTEKSTFSPFLYFVSRVMLRCFFKWKCKVTIEGMENVPVEGGVIIASNHASYLDPPLLGHSLTSRPIRFMARDTLFKNPVVGWLFFRIGVVPLSRERGDVAAIKAAIRILKQGECIGLFPEGTRTLDGNLQPAKGGIGFLIAKASVPVVPAFIQGSYEAYPKGAKKITYGPIHVHFGKPIQADELLLKDDKGKADFDGIGNLVMTRIASLNPAKLNPTA